MKLSARNQLQGKVVAVEEGAVNGIVTLDIGGGNKIVSTISMDSIKNLGLKPGVDAYAIIKATSVMVGIEG
jgi:molybdopterin-binding protein